MNRIPWNPKKPKICVPIMEKTAQEVLEQAQQVSSMNIDLVEWRIDAFDQIEDLSKCIELALAVKEQLGQMDLLITCRTQKEGGFFSPGRDGRIPAGSESLLKRTVEKKECCLEFSDL